MRMLESSSRVEIPTGLAFKSAMVSEQDWAADLGRDTWLDVLRLRIQTVVANEAIVLSVMA